MISARSALTLLLLTLSSAVGSGEEGPGLSASRTGEWVIAGGYGMEADLGPGDSRVRLVSLAPQWGRFLGSGIE